MKNVLFRPVNSPKSVGKVIDTLLKIVATPINGKVVAFVKTVSVVIEL